MKNFLNYTLTHKKIWSNGMHLYKTWTLHESVQFFSLNTVIDIGNTMQRIVHAYCWSMIVTQFTILYLLYDHGISFYTKDIEYHFKIQDIQKKTISLYLFIQKTFEKNLSIKRQQTFCMSGCSKRLTLQSLKILRTISGNGPKRHRLPMPVSR